MIKRTMIAIHKPTGALLPMKIWAANDATAEVTAYVCGAAYFQALMEDRDRKRTS